MRYVLIAELVIIGALLAYDIALGIRRKLDPKAASRQLWTGVNLFVLTFALYDPSVPGGFARMTTRFMISTGIVVAMLGAIWLFFMWWSEKIWPK